MSATRDELLQQYREVRASVNLHLGSALKFVSKGAMTDAAHALKISHGSSQLSANLDVMQLVCDVAVFGKKPDERLRAFDRYARQCSFEVGSINAITLASLLDNKFCIVEVVERHDHAGLIVEDINRKTKMWLMDEGFESTAAPGLILGARIIKPTEFYLTAGGAIPVSHEIIADALSRRKIWLKNSPTATLDDLRFPAALYASALKSGAMKHFAYQGI